MRAAAAGLASLLALLQVLTAIADTATSDLVAGPPDGSWQANTDLTGSRSKDDIWGDKANTVQGFVDAYEKAWGQEPEQGLVDRLERFSSVFWAAFRLSDSRTAAKENSKHASYQDLRGIGTSAYEVTDPVDADGFLSDTIVLTKGDYVAVIAMAAKTTPNHDTLLDQARRQAALIPEPVGEYNAIGQGIFSTVVIVAIVAGVITLAVCAIVLIVVLRRRRPRPAALKLSPDRRYWWDGQAWQDTALRMPPGVAVSPDGSQWWDGAQWRPRPPA